MHVHIRCGATVDIPELSGARCSSALLNMWLCRAGKSGRRSVRELRLISAEGLAQSRRRKTRSFSVVHSSGNESWAEGDREIFALTELPVLRRNKNVDATTKELLDERLGRTS
jgi:hypothetical protein